MSSTWNRLSARAKAHHDSVNAAYATFYGAGTRTSSTSSTSETPRKQSASSSTSTSSASSTASSLKQTWHSLKHAAKEHNDSVNAAYAHFYGVGSSPAPAVQRSSSSSGSKRGSAAEKKSMSLGQRFKEHHRSVNNAYALLYGGGA